MNANHDSQEDNSHARYVYKVFFWVLIWRGNCSNNSYPSMELRTQWNQS